MPRHSREDALSDKEFDELYEATFDLTGYHELECRFILVVGGRLGLRAGEICHLKEDWISWERSRINIPRHEPCTDGKDGGPCGYCRTQAAQSVAKESNGNTLEEELAERWKPKTENSARAVPFDFDDRVQEAVEEFFFYHDAFEHSRSSINRRVDRMLRAAGYPKSKTYPHALRATAASSAAYRGVPPVALQSLFGWSDMSTAQKYIRLSGEATAEALRQAHSDD